MKTCTLNVPLEIRLDTPALSSLEEQFLKGVPRFFIGRWLPLFPVSVEMVPLCFNHAESRALGKPIYDR